LSVNLLAVSVPATQECCLKVFLTTVIIKEIYKGLL